MPCCATRLAMEEVSKLDKELSQERSYLQRERAHAMRLPRHVAMTGPMNVVIAPSIAAHPGVPAW